MAFVALLAGSAWAKDIKTIVYTPTPKLVCAKCQNGVKNSLRFVKGVKEVSSSIKDQTITISYDADKVKPETFVKELGKIGRKVEVVKAPATTSTSAKEAKK